MRLLMAASSDGFLATGPDDKMAWTGATDKAIFKLLTLTSGRPIFAGWKTAQMVPPLLGRVVHPLSRTGFTLGDAASRHPDAWLIGGPTIAAEALRLGLISQAVICQVLEPLGGGVPFDGLARYMPKEPAHAVKVCGVKVLLFTLLPF